MATKIETPVIELTPGNVKDATKGIKSSDLWQVPYEQLYIIPGYNVREHDEDYEAHIESLTKLIMANGYDRDKPMSGYVVEIEGVSRIAVTAGHTRYLAVGRARERGCDIQTVPVITKPRGTSMEDMTIDLVTSNSGRPLTPFEVGTVIKRLISYGMDEKVISEKLGVTLGYVNDLLTLQSASRPIREMVRTGKVSANLAITMIKKHGIKAAGVLQEAVKTAQSSGKKKASAKHVEPSHKEKVKKEAKFMYELLLSIKEDDSFLHLAETHVQQINELIERLPEPEEAAE